ncbi:MAG: hypothetical protein WCA46_18820 [Actinocatenispora sp.]
MTDSPPDREADPVALPDWPPIRPVLGVPARRAASRHSRGGAGTSDRAPAGDRPGAAVPDRADTLVAPHLDRALEFLLHRRVVVLAADRHQGRSTALRHLASLLARRLGTEPSVERLDLDNPPGPVMPARAATAADDESAKATAAEGRAAGARAAEDRTGLAAFVADAGHGRLLTGDLLDVTPSDWDRTLRDLVRVIATLQRSDSHLVLVVPTSDADRAERHLPYGVHRLGRPDADAVFDAWLGDRVGAELRASLHADRWFAGQLRDAWPPHAARLAHLATASVTAGRNLPTDIAADAQAALAVWATERQDPDDAVAGSRTGPSIGATGTRESSTMEERAAVLFWRAALGTLSHPVLRRMVDAWLRTAADLPPEQGDPLIEQLAQAPGDHYRRYGELLYAARPLTSATTGDHGTPEQASRFEALCHRLHTHLAELDPAHRDERLTAAAEAGPHP